MNKIIQNHQAKWAKDRKAKQSLTPGHSVPVDSGAMAKAVSVAVGATTADKKVAVEFAVLSETIKADVASLKTAHPEHPARNAATPPYLDKYREYCGEALERGDTAKSDPVLVQCAIWAINCADFEFAISLIDHCKSMDSGMKRSLPELCTDMVLQDERADDEHKAAVLERIESEAWTVNHPLKAKVFKWGAQYFETSDLEKAVHCAVTAHDTYPNVGVKTFMEVLQKRLAAQSGA